MSERVEIEAQGSIVPCELDFTTRCWEGPHVFDEADFPIVVTPADGKRYELYSDGTFAEEEVRAR